MTPELNSRIADALAESSRDLRDSIAGVSEAYAARKPGPDRWSVLECLEHLALAERGLLGRILAVEPGDALPEDPVREARVTGAVVNRTVHVEAPARALPAGRFPTLAVAIEQFDAARRETLVFWGEHSGDLRLRNVVHPLFGPLTGPEMLLIMAGHTRRHADQIREIRASIPE